MVKRLVLIPMCIPLMLVGNSNPTLKYKDVFKDMEKRDSLKEFNKNKRLKKIDVDSKKLIAKVDKLIKNKNLKSNNKLDKTKKEELSKRLFAQKDKIRGLR